MGRSWRVAVQGCAQLQATAIVSGKKEGAIAAIVQMGNADRTAYSSTEFIPHEVGFWNATEILEEIGGVERGIAMHLVHGAVKIVRSAANRHVHDATGVLPAVRASVR